MGEITNLPRARDDFGNVNPRSDRQVKLRPTAGGGTTTNIGYCTVTLSATGPLVPPPVLPEDPPTHTITYGTPVQIKGDPMPSGDSIVVNVCFMVLSATAGSSGSGPTAIYQGDGTIGAVFYDADMNNIWEGTCGSGGWNVNGGAGLQGLGGLNDIHLYNAGAQVGGAKYLGLVGHVANGFINLELKATLWWDQV